MAGRQHAHYNATSRLQSTHTGIFAYYTLLSTLYNTVTKAAQSLQLHKTKKIKYYIVILCKNLQDLQTPQQDSTMVSCRLVLT